MKNKKKQINYNFIFIILVLGIIFTFGCSMSPPTSSDDNSGTQKPEEPQTPLVINSITPSDGALFISASIDIVIVFNKELDDTVKGTISFGAPAIVFEDGTNCSITISNDTVTINPDSDFSNAANYSYITIQGFQDTAGNVMAVDNRIEYDFTTLDLTNAFISTWNTSNTNSGSSMDNQVRLPLVSSGSYDFIVNWGDGSIDTITTWDSPDVTHTYASEGIYQIAITGIINGFSFNNSGDRPKLLEISAWGNLNLGNDGGYFYGAKNLEITATDTLDLTGTTNLSNMFRECCSLTTAPSMNAWDVSNVTDMSGMFYGAYNFNQAIGLWDVSSVINMSEMFRAGCAGYEHQKFNQDIASWDVSNVTDMSYMFAGNHRSFMDAYMEYYNLFNQDIGSWDVSNVTDMSGMFSRAYAFNQDIGFWDVSNVTDMSNMFSCAEAFNQNINSWDVSNVISMSSMFSHAYSFNQDIGSWDVSSLTDMSNMFFRVTLSTVNYSGIIIGWTSLPSLHNGVRFHGGNSKYNASAVAARDTLVNTYGWNIDDGGLE